MKIFLRIAAAGLIILFCLTACDSQTPRNNNSEDDAIIPMLNAPEKTQKKVLKQAPAPKIVSESAPTAPDNDPVDALIKKAGEQLKWARKALIDEGFTVPEVNHIDQGDISVLGDTDDNTITKDPLLEAFEILNKPLEYNEIQ